MVNRAQVIDDALNLAKSDIIDYETALSMTEYLHKEQDYVPWKAALNGKIMIFQLLNKSEIRQEMLRPFSKDCLQYKEYDLYLGLKYIKNMLKTTPAYGDFKRFVI